MVQPLLLNVPLLCISLEVHLVGAKSFGTMLDLIVLIGYVIKNKPHPHAAQNQASPYQATYCLHYSIVIH